MWVRDGKIADVLLGDRARGTRPADGAEVIDADDLVVMPGLVDTHVHVNEPGRTDWEGFATAGMAAAAGGITTMVVMPLNCTPAATNVEALLGEARAAAGKCRVDYGFWGGLVPGNVDQLEPMWEAGALGFKAFMVDSGVEDFPGSSLDVLVEGAPMLAALGAPLLVHAENAEIIREATARSGLADEPTSYAKYEASRPADVEERAVHDLVQICMRNKGLRLHVVHVASAGAAVLIHIGATKLGLAITGETCPHYLTFAAEHVPAGGTIYKCAPPIRKADVREELWSWLGRGALSMVVSDHSPCPPAMKMLQTGDFARAWGGISSLQVGLSAMASGARLRGFDLVDLARWMAENPSVLAGVSRRKGRIAPGFDADLVLFDPDAEWTVDAARLYHRHKITPYHGRTLRGVVRRTILRGKTIYDASLANPFPSEPAGRWIKRDQ
ncbi:MAG TPA: allantoinase AllB [Phycisphaerales bacterium]|nr:allantoinase AllB [Phycisphaerales bacterium]